MTATTTYEQVKPPPAMGNRVIKIPSNYLSSEPPQPYRLKKTADAAVDVDPRGR